jgi:hypothetical protein
VVSKKVAAFWITVPYSIVASALMMEAASSSKTLVNFYQTIQCYNPEDSHLG